MPITVLDATTDLAVRCGAMMTLVGQDPTAATGSVTGPYAVALREGLASLHLAPASFAAVTDADLAPVPDARVPQLLDVAELRLLGTISGSYTQVDETISLGSIKSSQNHDRMTARLTWLAKYVRDAYGYGMGSLTCGSIKLGPDDRRHCRPGSPGWAYGRDDF